MNALNASETILQDRPFGPKAIQIYLVAILFYTTSHILLILLPLSSHKLGASPAQIGLIMGAYVLITLRFFGRKMIPTDGRFHYKMAVMLILLMTTAVGLVRMAESLPVVLLAAVCNGIALSMLYPTLLTYVSFIVPERFRGRGIGLFIAAADFGTSAGIWGLSLVASAYSYEAMFSGCIAIGPAALLLKLFFKKPGVSK